MNATKERRAITNRRKEIARLQAACGTAYLEDKIQRGDRETIEELLGYAEGRLDRAASFDGGHHWDAAPAFIDANALLEAARCILEPERPTR